MLFCRWAPCYVLSECAAQLKSKPCNIQVPAFKKAKAGVLSHRARTGNGAWSTCGGVRWPMRSTSWMRSAAASGVSSLCRSSAAVPSSAAPSAGAACAGDATDAC